MPMVRWFFQLFGRKKEERVAVQKIVPDFQENPEMECLITAFALGVLEYTGDMFYSLGSPDKGEEEKQDPRREELKRFLEMNGEGMKTYLKPYIEVWNVSQMVPSSEWHRWYAAGLLRQRVFDPPV